MLAHCCGRILLLGSSLCEYAQWHDAVAVLHISGSDKGSACPAEFRIEEFIRCQAETNYFQRRRIDWLRDLQHQLTGSERGNLRVQKPGVTLLWVTSAVETGQNFQGLGAQIGRQPGTRNASPIHKRVGSLRQVSCAFLNHFFLTMGSFSFVSFPHSTTSLTMATTRSFSGLCWTIAFVFTSKLNITSSEILY